MGHEHEPDGHEGPADRAARGADASGTTGVTELRAIPAGADGAGVPGATRQPGRAALAGVTAAAGEGPPDAGAEAAAAEGRAAGAGATGRDVRGPVRERPGVRQPGFREDARPFVDWTRA